MLVPSPHPPSHPGLWKPAQGRLGRRWIHTCGGGFCPGVKSLLCRGCPLLGVHLECMPLHSWCCLGGPPTCLSSGFLVTNPPVPFSQVPDHLAHLAAAARDSAQICALDAAHSHMGQMDGSFAVSWATPSRAAELSACGRYQQTRKAHLSAGLSFCPPLMDCGEHPRVPSADPRERRARS